MIHGRSTNIVRATGVTNRSFLQTFVQANISEFNSTLTSTFDSLTLFLTILEPHLTSHNSLAFIITSDHFFSTARQDTADAFV